MGDPRGYNAGMPPLDFRQVAVAFDMFGCPNRCRHCFVGRRPEGRIGEDEVRRVAGAFRGLKRGGEAAFEKVWVSTSVREPDFSDDYRQLHELEAELSDGPPHRFELLSVWRLARDEGYAEWARSVGPDTCQITFFGEAETTDWYCGRRGAFADALTATERLLEAGMKPRWQIFANTRGLGELDALMRRVDDLRLRHRVEELGGRFDVFMHPWGPSASAVDVEEYRPAAGDMARVPAELLASSREHFGREALWRTEAELYAEIQAREPWSPYAIEPEPTHMPWFLVDAAMDVYFNQFGWEPWWRLGNLAAEPLETILNRFESDDTPGLRTINTITPQQLAAPHGDPAGGKIYSDVNDLLCLYLARHFTPRRQQART